MPSIAMNLAKAHRAPSATLAMVRPVHLSRSRHAEVSRDVRMAGKGKTRFRQGGGRPQQQMPKPPTPPVDPDNEEFVVFVRAVAAPKWIPFTIVKGGAQANLLVKAMDGNFGKKFYSTTLINNIAQAVYKDKEKIDQSIRDNIPGYKKFTEFEYGFKIRDREEPDAWWKPNEVVLLPPEEDVPSNPFESIKASVGSMFGGGSK